MTNTKFRRRALVSSLAMLLVALVALGSATFAWFTENPVVTASGITAKGQVSQGLEIWTTTTNQYKKNSNTLMTEAAKATDAELVLTPLYANHTETSSVKTLTGWAKTSALAASASAAADSNSANKWTVGTGISAADAASTGMTLSGDYYHEQIKIKVTSGNAAPIKLTGFTMTKNQNAGTIANGITCLVVVNNVIKAMKKVDSTGTIMDYGAVTDNAAVSTSPTTWSQTTVDATSNAITLGDAGGESAPLIVDVYVFLDGTDANVYTNNAFAEQLLDGISLEFRK